MALTAAEQAELDALEGKYKLSEDEDAELKALEAKFGGPKERGMGEELARGAINALPIAGGLGGGVIGGTTGLLGGPAAPGTVPYGAIMGAGAGAAAGESLKRGLNSYFFPDEAAKIAKEMEGLNTAEQLAQTFVEPAKQGLNAMGGEMGGAILSKGINAGVKAASPKVSKWAENFAAKALGLERGTANKIIKKDGVEKINELGRYALDNELLSPLASVDDVLERNNALKDSLLSTRNNYLKNIDEAGASSFNAAQVAEDFQAAYPKPKDYMSNKSTQEAYDKVITDLMAAGNKPSSLQNADELRKIFGKAGKFEAASASPAAEVYQGAYGKLAEGIDKAGVDSAALAGIDPMSVGKINSQISLGIGAENLLNNAVAKQANKAIGLTDSIFAAPIFAGGDLLAGGGVLGAKKLAEKYGRQNAALFLDALTKQKATQQGQKILPYMMMLEKDTNDEK